jgi:uncharacterized protein YkwD
MARLGDEPHDEGPCDTRHRTAKVLEDPLMSMNPHPRNPLQPAKQAPQARRQLPTPQELTSYRNELLNAHNVLRQRVGSGALTINANLNLAAQVHATWMAENDSDSHVGANGSTVAQRVSAVNYAAGRTSENNAGYQNTVTEVMRAWI